MIVVQNLYSSTFFYILISWYKNIYQKWNYIFYVSTHTQLKYIYAIVYYVNYKKCIQAHHTVDNPIIAFAKVWYSVLIWKRFRIIIFPK